VEFESRPLHHSATSESIGDNHDTLENAQTPIGRIVHGRTACINHGQRRSAAYEADPPATTRSRRGRETFTKKTPLKGTKAHDYIYRR
jgi:hypothetical protein